MEMKAEKGDKQYSSHHWTLGVTKKNSTTTCRGPRKVHSNSKLKPHPDAVYSIHLAQEKGFAAVADKVSRRSASQLHRKSGIPGRRQNFVPTALHAPACSKNDSQKCQELFTAAAASCRGAAPRHPNRHPKNPNRHRETCCGQRIHVKLISEFQEFHKMQCLKIKEE